MSSESLHICEYNLKHVGQLIELRICYTHTTHFTPLGPALTSDFPSFSFLSSFPSTQLRFISSISDMTESPAAARVWGTPELRSLIVNEMEIDEVRKSLCLSKTAFPDMVRALYRRFEYKNYAGLYELSVPVSRHIG